MLKQVHDHIIGELNQGARTDTIFVVTAVLFNLIVLGVNSAVATEASSEGANAASDMILGVFILMSMLVNGISITALFFGRGTRTKLLNGLLAMYRDNDVEQYYDVSLLSNYGKRYFLFMGVILALAATSLAVPLIVRFA